MPGTAVQQSANHQRMVPSQSNHHQPASHHERPLTDSGRMTASKMSFGDLKHGRRRAICNLPVVSVAFEASTSPLSILAHPQCEQMTKRKLTSIHELGGSIGSCRNSTESHMVATKSKPDSCTH